MSLADRGRGCIRNGIGWLSAVSLNVGGGIRYIKPASCSLPSHAFTHKVVQKYVISWKQRPKHFKLFKQTKYHICDKNLPEMKDRLGPRMKTNPSPRPTVAKMADLGLAKIYIFFFKLLSIK